MIEIIPNWHPVFVHFPLALLSVSVVFFVLAAARKGHRLYKQWTTLAHWNLWLGAGFAAIAGFTGWLAYNSVAHDTPSHLAMTDHRNWAIATLAIFLPLAAWSAWSRHRSRPVSAVFVAVALVGLGVLLSTGWRGGELVFRYGLGVMSLPTTEAGGNEDVHADRPTPAPTVEAGAMSGDAPAAQRKPRADTGTTTHVHDDGRVHRH